MKMTLSISLTADEERLANSYAKIHSMSVEEAFKRALFELIEDEFDAADAEIAYREYVESGMQSRPFAELVAECGL